MGSYVGLSAKVVSRKGFCRTACFLSLIYSFKKHDVSFAWLAVQTGVGRTNHGSARLVDRRHLVSQLSRIKRGLFALFLPGAAEF